MKAKRSSKWASAAVAAELITGKILFLYGKVGSDFLT